MIMIRILFISRCELKIPPLLGVYQPSAAPSGCQAKRTVPVAPILAGQYPVRKRYVNLADWVLSTQKRTHRGDPEDAE